MTILITGASGFIGFHLTKRLLQSGEPVVGIDNFNSYYDVSLKHSRANLLRQTAAAYGSRFDLLDFGIEDMPRVVDTFKRFKPDKVVNLAAQAGVRYSIENPSAYIQSNLVGFSNILEACRHADVQHLVYASSSSVYGGNAKMPFSETDGVDHPVSLYAASKRSNELMAHSYSHLYNLPTTGLRFFTVYGPWGRPDMALFLFTKAILENNPLKVFNNGKMIRDFTYVADIVESIVRILNIPARPDPNFDKESPNPSSSWCPYRVFNIGNSTPIPLMEYIRTLEDVIGNKAILQYLPMQDGDVPATSSDTSLLNDWIGFIPSTSINNGISKFVSWYREYYKV